jgi:hypothetical protein
VRAAKIRTIGRKKVDFAGNLVSARTAGDESAYVTRSINKLCLLRAAEDEPALSVPQDIPESAPEED